VNYLEALEDIGGMVNDPDLTTYKDRVKLHFIRGLNTLIKSGEFGESDFAGYVKAKTDLSFASPPVDLSSLLVLDIIEIYMSPSTIKPAQCIEKTPSEVAKLSRNSEMTPAAEELFYWRIGNSLYAIVGSPSSMDLSADTFIMRYVEDVDDSGWVDGTDLQAAANYLSLRLVRSAIGVAVNTLMAEIAGE